MGFGFGALALSKGLAPFLMRVCDGSLPAVFRWTGVVLAVVGLPAAALLARAPAAAPPPAPATAHGTVAARPPSIRSFAALWLLFFCNIMAGVIFLAFQSPLLQDLLRARNARLTPAYLAAAGGTLIAVSSVCNGLGRSISGAICDWLGGLRTFRLLFVVQIALFLLLALTDHPVVFMTGVCAILLCYGGGFGTVPALIAELYGLARLPRVYGAMLTAWGAAGFIGPYLAAVLRDRATPPFVLFAFAILLLLVGIAASYGVKRRQGSLS